MYHVHLSIIRNTYRMASSGMLRRVALARTDGSEELSASFIRVTRIGELGTTLAVTSNRRSVHERSDQGPARTDHAVGIVQDVQRGGKLSTAYRHLEQRPLNATYCNDRIRPPLCVRLSALMTHSDIGSYSSNL
jgi:hypothetical protein